MPTAEMAQENWTLLQHVLKCCLPITFILMPKGLLKAASPLDTCTLITEYMTGWQEFLLLLLLSPNITASLRFYIIGLLRSIFRLPSCQRLCQLHLGMKLFVFISIQFFFSVFISKVPSCVCQLHWKAKDTTECGSRFNRFHAISTALRGICLPLAEERLSHSGGFLKQLVQSNPASLRKTEENEAAGFCSQAFLIAHLHKPPAWMSFFFFLNWQQQGPDEVKCNLLSQEKVRGFCAKTHTQRQ